MNVVIFSNAPIKRITDALNLPFSPKEGWVSAAIAMLQTVECNIFYVFPQRKTKEVIKGKIENIQYYEDHKEYFDIEEVEKRNAHKSEIMFKLYTTGKIRNIPYRLYFNSCNLEHVLYNELKDFSDDEKEILSDEFAEKYEGKVLEFIDFISDKSVSVEGTYKETWKYIEKDKNSLQRHSNMHLIFKTD